MQKLLFYMFLFILPAGFFSHLSAQVRVAIAEFKNESSAFYLDQWEKSIPDLLQEKLSRSSDLIILERRKLKAVLEEKALSMAGLTDSTSIQEIGKLLDAEYVITGAIHKFRNRYRIDASIVKVNSAETRSEKVDAPDRDHLPQMVNLLANNILYDLTGRGKYKSRIKLNRAPTKYFLLGTVGLAVATGLVRAAYEKKLDEYHQNTRLDQFDDLYRQANRSQKLSVGLAGLTGAALVGTVYCWIKNLSPREILAENSGQKSVIPYLAANFKIEVKIGLQIRF